MTSRTNILLCVLISVCCRVGLAGENAKAEVVDSRLRVIVTTDGEVDDRCSMNRFLLYANDWDVCGLIHSSSKYHWKGDEGHPGKAWEPVGWLDSMLDAYASVYPTLRKHDANYPSPEHLRSQVFVGNIAREGDIRHATPGSNHIVQVLLEADDRPVWLQAWGGSNTIARALKTIQEEYPDRMDQVSAKAHLYLITEQDDTLKTYLRKEWPKLEILRSGGPSFGAIAYRWPAHQSEAQRAYFDKSWMTANILRGHGGLCSLYEAQDGHFRSEGDTPSFLHVIRTGLRSEEHPSYGGWGGRFALNNSVWKSVDTNDTAPESHSILRWAIDFQNDWAARADWCVKGYSDANHPPNVILSHETRLTAQAGHQLKLDATNSNDPDGDGLSFKWQLYLEASHCQAAIPLEATRHSMADFDVPGEASAGETLHFICTVTDSGSPSLTRYARVVVTVVD